MSLGPCFFKEIGGSCLTGKEQNLALGKHLPDLYGSFDPVHVGHDDITNHQIRMAGSRSLHRRRPCVDRGGFEAVLIQDDGQGIGDDTLVVYYQDSGLGGLTVAFQS